MSAYCILELQSDAPEFVSRGAEKLHAALETFGLSVAGRTALDIGASTGGFTEVLLKKGARKVYAVEVGSDQLHPSLREDARVISLEKCDARKLDHEKIGDEIDLIVADVSFISLAKVLLPALGLAAPNAQLVALIKPQFEVGPEKVARGGIVRDENTRLGAVEAFRNWLCTQPGNWSVMAEMKSPIKGGDGNVEYLIGAVRGD